MTTRDEAKARLVCPACGTLNQAPLSRLHAGDIPKCGSCGAQMFDGRPVEIDSAAAFARHISRNDIPVVVDCWASWCGPCRMMAPQFEAAAARLQPKARLLKLDTEALGEVARGLNIMSIPTLVMFCGGREVARRSGVMDAGAIARWVEEAAC